MVYLIAAMIAFATQTGAISSGMVSVCDAFATYGCQNWPNGDRSMGGHKCTDKRNGIMPWAGAPFASSNYTLRAGDSLPSLDATSYTPGVPMGIHVRVMSPLGKWKGIVLHAVNYQNKTVGSWQIFGNGLALFQQIPTCPGVLLHIDADDKPYHVGPAHFLWVPPAAGTGPVTFRLLVKQGPANIGEFYWPIKNLVLLEKGNEAFNANPPTPAATNGTTANTTTTNTTVPPTAAPAPAAVGPAPVTRWQLAPVGVSCDDHCDTLDRLCDMNAMKTATGEELAQAVASESVSQCGPTALRDCSLASPAVLPDGVCFYHASDCTAEEIAAANGQTKQLPKDVTEATVCSARSTTARHLCVCSAALSSLSGPSALTMLLSAALGAFFLSSSDSDDSTPAPKRSSRSSPASRSGAVGLLSILVFTLLCAPSQAHNWMLSRSRSVFIAKAGRFCDPRKGQENHVQVGPGQQFAHQWATGHDRNTYVVVMHEDDAHIMTNTSYLKMIDQYLAEAPASANLIPTHAKYARVHLSSGSVVSLTANTEVLSQTNPYSAEVKWNKAAGATNDPLWNFVHPDDLGGRYSVLTTYNQSHPGVQKDLHVQYQNPKYPWFEAVHRYEHVFSRGGDADVAQITIPGTKCKPKPGATSCHYVAHWYWSGYSDCVDIDYFPKQQVNLIYGNKTSGGVQYLKIDHCHYDDPQQILGQCTLLKKPAANETLSAKACYDGMRQNDYFKVAFQGIPFQEETWSFGVNVVPASVPPAVQFPDSLKKMLPWTHGQCAGDFTRLTGVHTSMADDWTNWATRTVVTTGRSCLSNLWVKDLTLSQAIRECDADYRHDCYLGWTNRSRPPTADKCENATTFYPQVCFGISANASLSELQKGGVFTFSGCGSATLNTTAGAIAMMKNAAAMPAMAQAAIGPLIKISFQKDSSPMVRWDNSTAVGYNIENATKPYGPRANGLKYGFSCIVGVSAGDSLAAMVGRTPMKPLNDEVYSFPSVDSSYVTMSMNVKCPDGNERVWEIEVPNGVYKVSPTMESGNVDQPTDHTGFEFEDVRFPRTSVLNGLTSCNFTANRNCANWPAFPGNSRWHRHSTFLVEVVDGNFTLRSNGYYHNNPARYSQINTLELQKVAELGKMTPAWTPPAANPWYQVALEQPEPVGLVKIELPGPRDMKGPMQSPSRGTAMNLDMIGGNPTDSRPIWFLKGASNGFNGGTALKDPMPSQHPAFPGGVYTGADQGAIVSVSNTPCTTGACPLPKEEEICGVVSRVPTCSHPLFRGSVSVQKIPMNQQVQTLLALLCPIQVNCDGKVGKYVHIHLPGAKRILAVERVEVHRVQPKNIEPDMVACYPVEARPAQVLPFPRADMITTDDPEDPVFYSTCYMRTQVVTWLPTADSAPPLPDFLFHGKCLSCKAYQDNTNITDTYNGSAYTFPVPVWLTTGKCSDCDAPVTPQGITASRLASSTVAEVAANPKGIEYSWIRTPEGVGTMLLIFAVPIAVAALVFYIKRRKARLASGRALVGVQMELDNARSPSDWR